MAACIGKGKAGAAYEFGLKISIVITNARGSRRPVCAARQGGARPPYDGHTLRTAIEDTQKLTGREDRKSVV